MADRRLTFEDVDDDSFDDPDRMRIRWLVRPLLIVLAYLLMFAGVVVAFDPYGTNTLLLAGREIILLDWVSLLAVVVLGIVAIPPVVRKRGQVVSFLGALGRDTVAAVACVGLVAYVLAAIVGPLYVPEPAVEPAVIHNPPPGFSIPDWFPSSCAGEVSDGRCHGTWEHPFGTDEGGRDHFHTVVHGIQTSLQVGVSAAVISGGIGTIVGIVAGTVGGHLDALLMRYVDLQSAVPAFFVYVLLITLWASDLVLLVVVFGFLSWGGFARLVRSEVLQIREELFIEQAKSAGAGRLYRIRYHVLPNVTTGVFVPLTTLVPLYILYEAALSFLGLGETDPRIVSLGNEIEKGINQGIVQWWDVWWLPIFPALFLTLLVLSILLVGDRVGELLDPRED